MAAFDCREEVFNDVGVGAELVDFVLPDGLRQGGGFGLPEGDPFEAEQGIGGLVGGQIDGSVLGLVDLLDEEEGDRFVALVGDESELCVDPQHVDFLGEDGVHFLSLFEVGEHLAFVERQ